MKVSTKCGLALLGGLFVALCVSMYDLTERVRALESETRRSSSGGASRGAAEHRSVRDVDARSLPVADSPIKGSPNAPVGMIIYSDFECPFCLKFGTDNLPLIESEFVTSGRVAVYFKHLPIEKIHDFAMTAAKAGVCAQKANAFWSLHDALFSERVRDDAGLSRVLARLDLRVNDCFGKSETIAAIERDRNEANSLGISGTPAIVIGRQGGGVVRATKIVSGAQPASVFRIALNEVLAGG